MKLTTANEQVPSLAEPVPFSLSIPSWLRDSLIFVLTLLVALILFGILLAIMGKNPIDAYIAMYNGALADSYGWSEVAVKMIPFILTGLAVAIPAQVGLVNVGGEGQLYFGATVASVVALNFGDLHPVLLIPLLILCGALGGAIWGAVVGITRAYAGLNETISSLLLNYVAILFVDFLVHGPLKDPSGPNWAYSAMFSENARLYTFFGSRVSIGIIIALVAVVFYFWLINYTRWGYKLRLIGGNAEAASRSGIRVNRYIIGAMMLGAAFAGIAGMIEVTAIQWRLRPGISNDYGYMGFLVAWLALQKPARIVFIATLIGIISVGGDWLQIGAAVPSAAVNILLAMILFLVLRNQGIASAKESAS